jgi:hypothetical protein
VCVCDGTKLKCRTHVKHTHKAADGNAAKPGVRFAPSAVEKGGGADSDGGEEGEGDEEDEAARVARKREKALRKKNKRAQK